MSDLIEREDVLNVLKRLGWTPIDSLYLIMEQDIPSVVLDMSEFSDRLWKNAYERGKADRPQGMWIKDEDGTYRCSNCGGCEEQYIYGTENWYGCGESKFCPNCGARMKGTDND